MRAIDVRVCHDDDLVVSQFFEVQRIITTAKTRSDSRNQGADFLVVKHLIQTRFLHV